MTLHPLCEEILRLSEDHHTTPVLMRSRQLTFLPAFHWNLIETLVGMTDRPIRVDWYRGVDGWWSPIGDRLAASRARRIERGLARRLPHPYRQRAVSIQVTASIARPGGKDRPLVIGWCDDGDPLPGWATAIHLGGHATEAADLQCALNS